MKIGDKLTNINYNSAFILAQVSRENARQNKVALLNIETGKPFGRVAVVKNLNDITEFDMNNITGKRARFFASISNKQLKNIINFW